MLLSKTITIAAPFSGKSQDDFWESLLPGDRVKISTRIRWTGKYAMVVDLENLNTNKKTQTTGGRFDQYLKKLEYTDAD